MATAYVPHIHNDISYSLFPDEQVWMAQLVTWEAVHRDTTLTDSSALLSEFKTLAAGSRLAYLTNLEQLLAGGDVPGATAQLAITPPRRDTTDTVTGVRVKDDSTIDYLIDTYKGFYSIYLHYQTATMSAADSAQIPYIARLCPLEYGPVVYKARALYTAVFNDLQVWCEGCGQAQQQGDDPPQRRPASNDAGAQQYRLSPNPNSGTMTIKQAVADSGLVKIEVTDMLGQRVKYAELHFSEKAAQVQLPEVASGMYIMKLNDQKGRIFTFKFVVKE